MILCSSGILAIIIYTIILPSYMSFNHVLFTGPLINILQFCCHSLTNHTNQDKSSYMYNAFCCQINIILEQMVYLDHTRLYKSFVYKNKIVRYALRILKIFNYGLFVGHCNIHCNSFTGNGIYRTLLIHTVH